MEIFIGIGLMLGLIFIFPVLRFMITFIHEIGHAIPALIFTRGRVDVYLGSYNEQDTKKLISLGRLSIFGTFQPFGWQIGMCIPHGSSSFIGNLLIILGGPFASILLCSTLLYYTAGDHRSVYVTFILVVGFLLGLLDLFVNLIPSATKYRDENGNVVMSDGRQLISLFSFWDAEDDLLIMQQLVQQQKYKEAIPLLEDKLSQQPSKRIFYELLISAYIGTKNHPGIINTYEQLLEIHPLKNDDFRTVGLAYYHSGNYQKSLRYLNEYLFTNYMDYDCLYARAMIRMEMDDLEEAFLDFKSAVMVAPKHKESYPLAHIGYLYYKAEDIDKMLPMLEEAQSKSGAENNASLAFYWAIYHESKGHFQKAIDEYKRAETLGYDYHGYEYKYYDLGEALKR